MAASKTSRPSKTAKQVITDARDFLGVPYKHLGRDWNGIDCLGLTLYVLDVEEEGEFLYHKALESGKGYYSLDKWFGSTSYEEKKASQDILVEFLTNRLLSVPCEDMEAGDILLMRCINQKLDMERIFRV